MENNKKILIKFSLWLGVGIFLMFYGISHSLALTYTDIGEMRNVTTVLISPEYSGQPFEVPSNSGYAFNEVLQVDYIVENYNFVADKNYQLESYLAQQRFTNVNRYTVQTDSGKSCLISYENSILNNDAYPRWAFQCPENTTRIVISLTNSNGQYLWGGTGIFDWRTALLKYSDTSLSGSGSDSDNIINNQNQNTQSIINNQNQNTQSIINNQNNNTDKLIEDNKKNFQSCHQSYNLLEQPYTMLTSSTTLNGLTITLNSDYTITISGTATSNTFINITRVYNLFNNSVSGGSCNNGYCLSSNLNYDNNNHILYYYVSSGRTIDITLKPMITTEEHKNISYEPYGEEICSNKLDEQTNAINGLNDNINDDNTDGATSEASEFFSDFNTNTFGLTSIITAPLNLIQSLTSKTCTPLHLPLPYLNNKYLDLPCMSTIYSQHFGTFFTLYQTITYGIIAYWVCVRIFNHVKDFKNPEHDEIEVVDL